MTFIVTLKETTGAKIGITAEAETVKTALRDALSGYNEVRGIISRECPKLLAENEILSPVTPEAEKVKRLNELLRDEKAHFEKHVVNGKLLALDKNCTFCKAYYDKLSKKIQRISS